MGGGGCIEGEPALIGIALFYCCISTVLIEAGKWWAGCWFELLASWSPIDSARRHYPLAIIYTDIASLPAVLILCEAQRNKW